MFDPAVLLFIRDRGDLPSGIPLDRFRKTSDGEPLSVTPGTWPASVCVAQEGADAWQTGCRHEPAARCAEFGAAPRDNPDELQTFGICPADHTLRNTATR